MRLKRVFKKVEAESIDGRTHYSVAVYDLDTMTLVSRSETTTSYRRAEHYLQTGEFESAPKPVPVPTKPLPVSEPIWGRQKLKPKEFTLPDLSSDQLLRTRKAHLRLVNSIRTSSGLRRKAQEKLIQEQRQRQKQNLVIGI